MKKQNIGVGTILRSKKIPEHKMAALSITDLMQYATDNFFNLKLSEFSKLENN